MRKNSAFTMYELIMVIVLIGIIFAVTAPLMIEIGGNWQLAQIRNDLSASAVVAMDRMVREMRETGSTPGIIGANNSMFQFTDVNNNTITYSLSGTNLMRTVGGTANVLAANVSSLTFTYYGQTPSIIHGKWYTAVPIPAPVGTDGGSVYPSIRRVVIDLTLTSGSSLTIESEVYLRNWA